MAAVTTTAGLFAPIGWLSILLFLPSMLYFAFLLPWGFGAAHLVAGQGREAMASSLVLIGSGLLGPALGPLFVGLISDAGSAAHMTNRLGLGLLPVPIATISRAIAIMLGHHQIGRQRVE